MWEIKSSHLVRSQEGNFWILHFYGVGVISCSHGDDVAHNTTLHATKNLYIVLVKSTPQRRRKKKNWWVLSFSGALTADHFPSWNCDFAYFLGSIRRNKQGISRFHYVLYVFQFSTFINWIHWINRIILVVWCRIS